jgi:GNAT superfamily N-acetyltransferase
MKILEYDQVDPLQVLHVTLLALDFPFTPERAAEIRRTDPRPFACFTVNAVEDETVLGQVGVYRLPMVSTKGREDLGGVWAVSTHPAYSGRGVASMLLDEAHKRMREAGLRFSTLGTERSAISHKLYTKHGYVDMNVWATAFNTWERAHQPTRLRVEHPGPEGYDFLEKLFDWLARDYLGFAWRHKPFARLRERVSLENIWVVWENSEPAGFLFAYKDDVLLRVNVQLLRPGINAAEAVASVVSQIKSCYVQVSLSRPSDMISLRNAGYRVAQPSWGAFMVKPLTPDVTIEDARRLFGIGSDRFLISWLDTT